MLQTKLDRFIEKSITRVGTITKWVGGVVLVGMTMLIVLDVFLRFVFNRPIGYVLELVEFGLMILVFFGIIYCTASSAHIKMEAFVSRLRPQVQSTINLIVTFLGLALFVIIGFQCIAHAMELRKIGQVSMMLGLPHHPFALMAGLCSLCVSLILLTQIVRSLLKRSI